MILRPETETLGLWTGCLLVGCLLVGCVRFGFETDRQQGPSDGAAGEGSTDQALPFAQLGPFSSPRPLGVINSFWYDDDPTLTADLLEIIFESYRPGSKGKGDLWVATRADPTDPWDPPTALAALNTPAEDTTPELSPDGLTLYFASDRLETGDLEIYLTTRPHRGAPWSAPELVEELSTPQDDTSATLSADGLFLTMASGVSDDNTFDLYWSTRSSVDDPWSALTPFVELNSPQNEDSVTFTSDQTLFVLASYRPGGKGGGDIWQAIRPSDQQPFMSPSPINEVNSDANEHDPWISPDGRTIVFVSDRTGQNDLYMASR